MEKKKIVYEAPETKQVLLKMERYFMQGSPNPNQGTSGEGFESEDGTW